MRAILAEVSKGSSGCTRAVTCSSTLRMQARIAVTKAGSCMATGRDSSTTDSSTRWWLVVVVAVAVVVVVGQLTAVGASANHLRSQQTPRPDR